MSDKEPYVPTDVDFRIHAANMIVNSCRDIFRIGLDRDGNIIRDNGKVAREIIINAEILAAWLKDGTAPDPLSAKDADDGVA